MAYTQTDLDNIRKAIASGVLTVRVNGRLVTYADMDQLLKAERRIEQALQNSSGAAGLRHSLADFSG